MIMKQFSAGSGRTGHKEGTAELLGKAVDSSLVMRFVRQH